MLDGIPKIIKNDKTSLANFKGAIEETYFQNGANEPPMEFWFVCTRAAIIVTALEKLIGDAV